MVPLSEISAEISKLLSWKGHAYLALLFMHQSVRKIDTCILHTSIYAVF